MYVCNRWTIKKAEDWWTDAFELWCRRRLLSPLDCKEIQPVHPKGNQSWVFIGRTDTEVETAILWPHDAKNWLIWKDPDDGKDWRQEEKGMTEDEMVGWHHHLNGHEFEQAPGDSEGEGSLACYSPWGCKQSDMTEGLNNSNNISIQINLSPQIEFIIIYELSFNFTSTPLLKTTSNKIENLINSSIYSL